MKTNKILEFLLLGGGMLTVCACEKPDKDGDGNEGEAAPQSPAPNGTTDPNKANSKPNVPGSSGTTDPNKVNPKPNVPGPSVPVQNGTTDPDKVNPKSNVQKGTAPHQTTPPAEKPGAPNQDQDEAGVPPTVVSLPQQTPQPTAGPQQDQGKPSNPPEEQPGAIVKPPQTTFKLNDSTKISDILLEGNLPTLLGKDFPAMEQGENFADKYLVEYKINNVWVNLSVFHNVVKYFDNFLSTNKMAQEVTIGHLASLLKQTVSQKNQTDAKFDNKNLSLGKEEEENNSIFRCVEMTADSPGDGAVLVCYNNFVYLCVGRTNIGLGEWRKYSDTNQNWDFTGDGNSQGEVTSAYKERIGKSNTPQTGTNQ